MSTPKERQVLIHIIEMYKNMPCLWDKNHEDYRNKHKRNNANKLLLEEYKTLDNDATMYTFNKKISNLRTNYFKELRKVQDSQTADDGEIYVPTLWYFNAFSFLDDIASNTSEYCHSQRKDPLKTEEHTVIIGDFKTCMMKDDVCSHKLQSFVSSVNMHILQLYATHHATPSLFTSIPSASDGEESYQESETHSSPPVKKRKFIKPIVYKRNNSRELAAKPSQMSNEEWEVLGKALSLQLRDLDKTQLTIAQKIISDTIYYAKFGLLSHDSYVNVENSPT